MNVGEAVVKEVIKQGQKYFLDKENQQRSSQLEQIRRFFRSSYSDGGQVEIKIPTWFEVDKNEIPIRTATSASIRSGPVKEGAYYGNLYKDQFFRIRDYQEQQLKTFIRTPNMSSTRMLVAEEYKDWAERKLAPMRADSPDELREIECRITLLNYLTRDNHLFNSGGFLFPDSFRAVLRSCMIDLESIREEMQARLETSAALTDLERLYTNDANLFGEICMFVCLAFRNTAKLQLGHMKSLIDPASSLFRTVTKTTSGKHIITVARTLKIDEDSRSPKIANRPPEIESDDSDQPRADTRVPTDIMTFFEVEEEEELPGTSSTVLGYHVDPRSGVAEYFLKRPTRQTERGMESFLEIHQALQSFAKVINFVRDAIEVAKFGGDLLIYGVASEKLILVMQKHTVLFSKIRFHMQRIYRAMRSYLDDHIIHKTDIDKHWQINQAYADGHYLNLFSGSDCMFKRCARDAELITERAQQPFTDILRKGCAKTESWIRDIDKFFASEGVFTSGNTEDIIQDMHHMETIIQKSEYRKMVDQTCHIIDYNTDPPQFMVSSINNAKGSMLERFSKSIQTVLVIGNTNSGKSSLIHALGCIPKGPERHPIVSKEQHTTTVPSFYLTHHMILIDLPSLTPDSNWLKKQVDTALLVIDGNVADGNVTSKVKALYFTLKSNGINRIMLVRNKSDLDEKVDLSEISTALDVQEDSIFLTNCRGFDVHDINENGDPYTFELSDGILDLIAALNDGRGSNTQIALLWQYYTQGKNNPFASDKKCQQERIKVLTKKELMPDKESSKRFRIHHTRSTPEIAREWWNAISNTLIFDHEFDKSIVEDLERCIFQKGKRRYYGSRLEPNQRDHGFFSASLVFQIDVIHIISLYHQKSKEYEIFLSADQVVWKLANANLIGAHFVDWCDYCSHVCRYEDIPFLQPTNHNEPQRKPRMSQSFSQNEKSKDKPVVSRSTKNKPKQCPPEARSSGSISNVVQQRTLAIRGGSMSNVTHRTADDQKRMDLTKNARKFRGRALSEDIGRKPHLRDMTNISSSQTVTPDMFR